MSNPQNNRYKGKLPLFIILAILSIIVALWKLGFSINFWVILLLWVIVYLVFFIKPFTKIITILRLVVAAVFIFAMMVSFKIILNDGSDSSSTGNVEKSADGIILADCTSTASDKPVTIDGWKSVIYSGSLGTSSPDPDESNNVRTFSYKGIKNRTETNSIYSRIERNDSSFMTGFGTTIEACSSDNKTTKSFTTASTKSVSEGDVIASTNYLHGGKYLHGPGDYRIDAYLKTLDGKWHLINRLD